MDCPDIRSPDGQGGIPGHHPRSVCRVSIVVSSFPAVMDRRTCGDHTFQPAVRGHFYRNASHLSSRYVSQEPSGYFGTFAEKLLITFFSFLSRCFSFHASSSLGNNVAGNQVSLPSTQIIPEHGTRSLFLVL